MGMIPAISCETKEYKKLDMNDPNPNPFYFQIIKSKQVKNHCVALIKYPNCTNFEGKKIIVFLNCHKDKLKNIKRLDPHFVKNDSLNIFARFRPTKDGWDAAIKLLKVI